MAVVAILAAIAINQIPKRKSQNSNSDTPGVTTPSYPYERPSQPLPPITNNSQPTQQENTPPTNQPPVERGQNHIEQIDERTWQIHNVPFIETDVRSRLQYEGNFDYAISILNEGAIQIDVSKDGGSMLNPNNMMMSCYFVVSDGRVVMGNVVTPNGVQRVDLNGMNPQIPTDIAAAFNVFLESGLLNSLPENVQRIIIGR